MELSERVAVVETITDNLVVWQEKQNGTMVEINRRINHVLLATIGGLFTFLVLILSTLIPIILLN